MISVIIPTYNRKELLARALASLVEQDYDNFEVLVINDGGQDINQVIDNFKNKLKINCYNEGHHGVCRARNIGMKKAQGDILAFFDDDALASKNWLSQIKKAINTNKVIVGKGLPITKNKWQYFAPHYDLGDEVKSINTIWECNFAIKKKVYEKVGGFDEKMKWGYEGNELATRIRMAGYEIKYQPEVVIFHDYATSLKNYLIKQFKFGQKLAYLEKRGTAVNVGEKIYNKKLEKLVWYKKIFIKIIAKIGSWFYKAGEKTF